MDLGDGLKRYVPSHKTDGGLASCLLRSQSLRFLRDSYRHKRVGGIPGTQL